MSEYSEKDAMAVDDESLALNETSTVLLLSDELIDEDDDDVYMAEGDEEEEDDDVAVAVDYEAVAGTELDMIDSSFDYLDEETNDADLVEENPFEPVYPATAGLLFAEEEAENSPSEENNFAGAEKQVQGRVLEPVSLDNILPEGSRRRRG